MLTEKQQLQFIEFYKSLYWDTSKETWTWELPHIPADKEEEHYKIWEEKLTEIMWKRNAKQPYIHKGWRKDTRLWKVMEGLRLCYWPVIDGKKRDK